MRHLSKSVLQVLLLSFTQSQKGTVHFTVDVWIMRKVFGNSWNRLQVWRMKRSQFLIRFRNRLMWTACLKALSHRATIDSTGRFKILLHVYKWYRNKFANAHLFPSVWTSLPKDMVIYGRNDTVSSSHHNDESSELRWIKHWRCRINITFSPHKNLLSLSPDIYLRQILEKSFQRQHLT